MDSKTFVMHVAIRERKKMVIDSGRKTQIKAQNGAQVGALLFDEASTKVPLEYSDYSNVFSAKNIAELAENTGINKHTTKLEKDKQPVFGPIYCLSLAELETFKTYIETNLANGFIRPSKFPAGASILFDRKPNRNLRLCMDYWGLNNITIKN